MVRAELLLAAGVTLALTTGCVSPSFTDSDFSLKAGNTAKSAASSLGTALLGAKLGGAHKATEQYLSVLIGAAEKDTLSVQGTFDSVQPPSRRSDQVRDELDKLLADATDGLATLRIAVRRGQLSQLPALAEPLASTLKALQDFSDAHS